MPWVVTGHTHKGERHAAVLLLLPPLREVNFVSRLQQHNSTFPRKITQARTNTGITKVQSGHQHGRKALAVGRSGCACGAQKAWVQWRGVEWATALEEHKQRKREEILELIRKAGEFKAEK
jgi:hypothetical protein